MRRVTAGARIAFRCGAICSRVAGDAATSEFAMPSSIDARLAELGITLPDVPAPAANYVPFVAAGGLVYVSGQVSRDANGHSVTAGGHGIGDGQAAGHDQGERAWPERAGQGIQPIGRLPTDPAQFVWPRQVDDQGIRRRAFLGRKNAADGLGVEGVGAQTIDGLRRKSDEAAVRQHLSGQGHRRRVRSTGIDREDASFRHRGRL